MTSPNLSGLIARPHVETVYRCSGCPCLETEDWSFQEENDGVDRGTDAKCNAMQPPKHIGSYWHSGDRTPSWCPALLEVPNV